MTYIIKIALAILFLICLASMPYGYFQLVRFLALVGFSILAYDAHTKGDSKTQWMYIALAILFQPLLKISLGRQLWNSVDVIVAIGLIISVVTDTIRKK